MTIINDPDISRIMRACWRACMVEWLDCASVPELLQAQTVFANDPETHTDLLMALERGWARHLPTLYTHNRAA